MFRSPKRCPRQAPKGHVPNHVAIIAEWTEILAAGVEKGEEERRENMHLHILSSLRATCNALPAETLSAVDIAQICFSAPTADLTLLKRMDGRWKGKWKREGACLSSLR